MFGFLTCLNLCCAVLMSWQYAEMQNAMNLILGVFNMVVACVTSHMWGSEKC